MPNNARPIQFHDHLPEVFRVGEDKGVTFLNRFLKAFEAVFEELEASIEGTPDGILQLTVQSATDAKIRVAPFNSGAVGFPGGTTVTVSKRTTLVQAIPAYQTGLTQIEVQDATFAAALEKGDVLYVQPEGAPGGILQLTVESSSDTKITVAPYTSGPVEFPVGTPVTVSKRTALKQAIPANHTGLTEIEVEDTSFAAALERDDILNVHPGGIPDMFSPDKTPPPQFMHRPEQDFEYLNYLAGWIALPLRTDVIQYEEETDADYAARRTEWNRLFFKTAIPHNKERSTLPGMEWLLRAWLKNDMLQTTRPILTDLTRAHTDVDAIFQLGETATVGVDTVLGEGPPFFFITDLVTDPAVRELRNPVWLDVFQRAARFLLDAEKPAHTYYQLRVRAHTMQLAPENAEGKSGEVYAQVGETTLLWDAPWIFNSD